MTDLRFLLGLYTHVESITRAKLSHPFPSKLSLSFSLSHRVHVTHGLFWSKSAVNGNLPHLKISIDAHHIRQSKKVNSQHKQALQTIKQLFVPFPPLLIGHTS